MGFLASANMLIPFAVGFVSLLFLLFDFASRQSFRERTFVVLFLYFVCVLLNWGGMMVYFYAPEVFVWMNSFCMLSFVLAQILFYDFVFHLTRLDTRASFSGYHYLLPLLLFGFFLILSLITPYEDQMQSLFHHEEGFSNASFFARVSNSKMLIRLLFSFVYVGLSLKRLISYSNEVPHYSSNYEKSSLRWVRIYLLLSILFIPIPVIALLLRREEAVSSGFLFVQVLGLVFQYAYVTYHVTPRNFIRFETVEREIDVEDGSCMCEQLAVEPSEGNGAESLPKQRLNTDCLESVIRDKRLYLNSGLKLSDLAYELQTNRTYLSSFINTAYQMNFNRFINRFRMEEFQRLKQQEAYSQTPDRELAEMSGFGSYKNFKRYLDSSDL